MFIRKVWKAAFVLHLHLLAIYFLSSFPVKAGRHVPGTAPRTGLPFHKLSLKFHKKYQFHGIVHRKCPTSMKVRAENLLYTM